MPRRCNHTQGEQDDEPEAPDNVAQAGSRGCGFTPPYSRLQVFVACERKTGVQRGGTARVADQDPSGQVSREAFFRKLPSFAAVGTAEHAAVSRDHDHFAADRHGKRHRERFGHRLADRAPALTWMIAPEYLPGAYRPETGRGRRIKTDSLHAVAGNSASSPVPTPSRIVARPDRSPGYRVDVVRTPRRRQ